MPSPLLPILIAAGTAWVGSFFKNTDAKLSRERQQRDAELAKAENIYEEISNNLDTLYYYQHDVVMYVAVRKGLGEPRDPIDQQDWANYNVALTNWRANESRLLSEHIAYFGKEHHETLLKISRSIIKGEKMIGSTYYKQDTEYDILMQTRNQKDGTPNYRKFFGLYSGISDDIRSVVLDMNQKLSRENVGNLGKP